MRGQCRDDSDCTPWAPSCSPLGYCRGGVQVFQQKMFWIKNILTKQDGSFGSRTNPKPGGEASDWIKANAKSGAGRNEEYYGKIEDDNRRNHVEFRSDMLMERYLVLSEHSGRNIPASSPRCRWTDWRR